MEHKTYKGLQERLTYFGLPVSYFMILVVYSYVVALIFSIYPLLLLNIPGFIILRILAKRDPFMIDIIIDSFFLKKEYKGKN